MYKRQTLHTNDAPGSITRLLDMGVEDYLLTSTVHAVLGQRLVRTLCPHCREAYTPTDEVVMRLGLRRYAGDKAITLYRAVGCEHCGHSGYSGRNAIVELLVMTDAIKQLILRHSDAGEIARVAAEAGMHSMLDDGLRKAVAGITTIEEVRRVTQEKSHTQMQNEYPAAEDTAGTEAAQAVDTTQHTSTSISSDEQHADSDSPDGWFPGKLSKFKPKK